MVDQLLVLRQEFIGFVEFLSNCMVEKNHLHGTDLKSSGKDDIHNLTHITTLDGMRFNDAKSGVFDTRTRLNKNILYLDNSCIREDEVELSLN